VNGGASPRHSSFKPPLRPPFKPGGTSGGCCSPPVMQLPGTWRLMAWTYCGRQAHPRCALLCHGCVSLGRCRAFRDPNSQSRWLPLSLTCCGRQAHPFLSPSMLPGSEAEQSVWRPPLHPPPHHACSFHHCMHARRLKGLTLHAFTAPEGVDTACIHGA